MKWGGVNYCRHSCSFSEVEKYTRTYVCISAPNAIHALKYLSIMYMYVHYVSDTCQNVQLYIAQFYWYTRTHVEAFHWTTYICTYTHFRLIDECATFKRLCGFTYCINMYNVHVRNIHELNSPSPGSIIMYIHT